MIFNFNFSNLSYMKKPPGTSFCEQTMQIFPIIDLKNSFKPRALFKEIIKTLFGQKYFFKKYVKPLHCGTTTNISYSAYMSRNEGINQTNLMNKSQELAHRNFVKQKRLKRTDIPTYSYENFIRNLKKLLSLFDT